MPALLPDDFIPDVNTRLSFYKRIASADDSRELDDLKVELIDRFGNLPDAARNLLDIAALRLTAQQLGVRRIEASEKGGFIEFAEKNKVDPAWLIGLLQQDPQQWRLDGPTRLKFTRDLTERKLRMSWLRELMEQMQQHTLTG